MKTRLLPIVASMAALFWISPLAWGIYFYQGFTVDFDDGRRSDGYISYDDRELTRSGTEFLLNLDDFYGDYEYDEGRPAKPNEHEGFYSFSLKIDGVNFGMQDRFEYSMAPYLEFEDGVLTDFFYEGLVRENRVEWPDYRFEWYLSAGGVDKRSIYFLERNLSIGTDSQSWGTASLISDEAGPGSDFANQLRWYGVSNWHSRLDRTSFATPYAELQRNDGLDDGDLPWGDGAQLLIEGIFGDSDLENGFGLQQEDGGFITLLTNLDPLQSTTIDMSASGSGELRFAVDQGSGAPTFIPLYQNENVRTFVSTGTDKTYIIWMLDDTIAGGDSIYRDFNDFIILATLKAVPEPAVAITLLSLTLVGIALWRHTRTGS